MNHSPNDIGEVIPTATLPTLRFKVPGEHAYAYHPEDPMQEIENNLPILKNKDNLSQTICIFTGMGLGYTPLTALSHRKDIFRMLVLEPDLDFFYLALKYVDLRPLLLSDKVFILAGDIDWDEFYSIVTKKSIETDFLFSDYNPLFGWKPELYAGTKENARALAVRVIAGLAVIKRFGEQIFQNRISNLTLLRHSSQVDVLKGAFRDKPAILVSAGPSLGKSMEALKAAVGKSIIIAVDSAVVPLLNHGIKPDFVTTLDYQGINAEKLSPDILHRSDFYLVANISSSSVTPKRLHLNHLFFSFQDNDTQDWLLNALGVRYQMPASGSVALLSLSLAQMIEADPVVFVGHDFALTSAEIDHAEGAVLSNGYYLTLDDALSVKGIDSRPIATTNSFLEFKRSFEQQMVNCKRNYINATATGAHIEGSSVFSLEAVIQKHMTSTFSLVEVVNEYLNDVSKVNVHEFIKPAKSILSKAENSLSYVKKMLTQTSKITSLTKNRKQKLVRAKEFSDLPLKIQTCKQKIHKLYSHYSPFLPMEELAAKKSSSEDGAVLMTHGSRYIHQVIKENSSVDVLMKAHQYGLQRFIQSIGELILFLEKEDKLIQKIEQGNITEKELFQLVHHYLNVKCFVAAEKTLHKFIELFPDSSNIPRVEMLMGITAAQLLDFDTAYRLWDKAQKKDLEIKDEIINFRKELAEYWLGWGHGGEGEGYAITEHKLRRALKIWDGIELWKDTKELFWEECSIHIAGAIEGGKIEEAELYLSLSKLIQDVTPEWNYYRAQLLFKQDDISEALNIMSDLLKIEPENAEWLSFSAKVLFKAGDNDGGVEELMKAVEIDSNQAVLWEELGDILFLEKDYTSAAIAYEKCFVALPDNIESLRKFGDCFFRTNQIEAARIAYMEVLKRDQSNKFARENLHTIETQYK